METFWLSPIVVLVCLLVYQLSKIGSRPPGCPPGPPTLPLIGNLHLMPKKDGHLQFQKWAQEYGPIYSLVLGTKVMIVLSSDQAVKDLLDKRSNIYSSRPDAYLGRIICGGLRMVLMPYGERLRKIHKIYHSTLRPKSVRTFEPYQDLENKQMLRGLLDAPELFVDHIRRYTNSLSTQIVYGFRTISIDDARLKKLFLGIHKWSLVLSSATAAMLDLYPVLRRLPDLMLPMRPYCKELHRDEKPFYVQLWMEVKHRLRDKTAMPSFCVDLVEMQKKGDISDDEAAYISSSLLEAGSDTTAAELVGFVQALVLFPQVQKAAQAELDRVCGDRLPTMHDDLPYIRCCIKECLRWMPTAVMGIPHAVVRDDEYMGYRIPKDSTVVLNVWTINMDPKRHPKPRVFDPSRYEGDLQTAAEAAVNPDVSKRDHFVFGAGRRACPGMHIAERSLFLAISRLLWAFRFERVKGPDGEEIVPDPDALTQGMLIQPLPFPARITPRSEKHVQAITDAWESCQELLDGEKQWKEIPAGMAFSMPAGYQ